MTALAKIHIAKKQLGLDDDTYRAVLVRVTGKASARDMSPAEHRAVLDDMTARGFKASSKGAKTGLAGPYAPKLRALWIALWNLGAVDDRCDGALIAFAARQTGIDRIEWVRDAASGRAVVEALKAWAAREGVDWSPRKDVHLDRHGYRIARAQVLKLGGAPGGDLWATVSSILRRPILTTKPTDEEWIIIMNELGRRVRAGKAAG